ncbi:sulfotransferase [uncultured Psychroserpens sp.]|uniref:sulfotransferase n=1 Tax=uncultured Psychroserpens sp. TaxID=255436 RepID=UPI00263434EC|nr:sulfotransferase [uncultured Psychroserpens sp.]
MNNLIILLGQRVRSGTNFVGSTISQHPHVVTLPQNGSQGEFNLFYSEDIIKNVYQYVAKASFGMEFNQSDQDAFLKEYGTLWLNLLIDKYQVKPEETIFVKSPSVAHLDLWKRAFPEAQIAVICRDGRDNVISSVRASNDKRTWHDFKIKLKKKFNYFSGRSFINHSKQWAKTANYISAIQSNDQVELFRYEDLNDSKVNISKLLEHYKLEVDDGILDRCLNAPVVGSSFGIASNAMVKPNWKPDTDKSKFKFSNKWNHWKFIKKTVFKSIAGQQLINLGYEENKSW